MREPLDIEPPSPFFAHRRPAGIQVRQREARARTCPCAGGGSPLGGKTRARLVGIARRRDRRSIALPWQASGQKRQLLVSIRLELQGVPEVSSGVVDHNSAVL